MLHSPRIALAVFLLVACVGAPSLDRSGYTVNVCRSGRWDPLAGVSLAEPLLSLQLVVVTSGGPLGASRQVVSSTGMACAAPDPAGCVRALADAVVPTGWQTQMCGGAGCTTITRFILVERAGVVSAVSDDLGLAALLAPVATPATAALLAALRYGPEAMDCSAPQVRGNTDGSFDVFLLAGDGQCTDRVESSVRVDTHGTSSLLQRVTAPATRTCVSP